MKAALAPIRPLLAAGKVPRWPGGDRHGEGDRRIGKNIVAAMLEGNGFEVVDLGSMRRRSGSSKRRGFGKPTSYDRPC
jgi:hypothetical protein